MAVVSNGAQVYGASRRPSEAELGELTRLRERFRSHHIFWDVTELRGIRFTARTRMFGVQPHTLVTPDLAELRDVLEQAALAG